MANIVTFGDTTFHVGDTIRVHYKLIEKEKVAGKTKREVKEEVRERIQVFEGIVIAIKGENESKSFTVRRVAVGNIGVERIFPLISPWIKKISVKIKGKAKRAKLYFIRGKTSKETEKITQGVKVKEGQEKKIKLTELSDQAIKSTVEPDKKPVVQNETPAK
ncbi:50S ribosomal protein L19 [Candidatus Gottesmanbacteria bacterium]|nr:50S ribosomal protein L19 [Candidatus Gottesmanbacteria bacterium]